MKAIDFYQITDGQTGAQVAAGLQNNFEALDNALLSLKPIALDPNSGMISDEESYNTILPQSYLQQYPWKPDYAAGLPWIWLNLKQPIKEGTVIMIRHNNKFCSFANIPENLGVVGGTNNTVLTTKVINNYLGFEVQKDLGVDKQDVSGLYQVYVINEDGSVLQDFYFGL